MPSGRRHRDTGFAQSAAQRIGKAGPLFRAEKAADDPAAATGNKRKLAPEEDPSTIMQPDAVADVIAMLVGEGERTLDGQNIIVRQQA